MSTPFYDLASLVVVPSGYKASKVYAQKPLTTDGQLAFTRSTTATRVNSAGLIESVAINVPRLDYLNSTCPKLLLEPSRTNYITKSLNFAGWLAVEGTTLTSNTTETLDPEGTNLATKFANTVNTGNRRVYDLVSLPTNASAAVSIFAKAGTSNQILITATSNNINTEFNVATGTIVSGSGKVENYGNGWFRCTAYGTNVGTEVVQIWNLGTTGQTCYFYGCQWEQAAYATSFIKTTTAAVTRGADAASKTGISSLIGQTEGTFFAEIYVPSIASTGTYANFALNDGTSSNLVDFTYYPDGRIQAVAIVSGSITVNINLTSYGLTAGNHKIALAYKLNDYVLYVDGTQAGADTSSAVPAMSKFDLHLGSGSTQVYNQALLFKTRLTNAQLAELTTI